MKYVYHTNEMKKKEYDSLNGKIEGCSSAEEIIGVITKENIEMKIIEASSMPKFLFRQVLSDGELYRTCPHFYDDQKEAVYYGLMRREFKMLLLFHMETGIWRTSEFEDGDNDP